MAIITQSARDQLDRIGVQVYYVSRQETKWWNRRRSRGDGDLAMLSGWHWEARRREAGPFRSRSAAERDAYYRLSLHIEPPSLQRSDVQAIRDEADAASRKARRRKRASADAHA